MLDSNARSAHNRERPAIEIAPEGLRPVVHLRGQCLWAQRICRHKEAAKIPECTLHLPEALYRRLANNARATQRSLEEVLLHAVRVGSPPAWEDVPPEYQSDLAQMDRLSDDELWQNVRAQQSALEVTPYDELLERNQAGPLTDAERMKLHDLRSAAERLMLRKAHAAALLRWRGHAVPQP